VRQVLLALYSHLWLDEQLGRREWVSIALCFLGTLLLAVTLVPRDWLHTDIRWIQARRGSLLTKPSPGVYFWDVPPVFHLYPACISPYPWYPVYPYIVDLYLAILQRVHCIPLCLTVSSCIRTYLAVSSCIPLYLTVSHRLENGM